ncbi:MAG: YegP family protein [Promicromonosporaceae bacterium]|nr:YegP family protein [Promicromonosporaceae bacterium]
MAGKFELWVDKAGDYRWNLKAGNGQVIATSQGYSSKDSALNGIASVRTNAPDAEVVEVER